MNKVRKLIIIIGLPLIGFIIGYLIANIPKLRYDLNNDGKVNIADVTKLVNYYLNK